MVAGLSFLFQAKDALTAKNFASAISPPADPDILHYAWLVSVPAIPSTKKGYQWYLLSTVYDEDFTAYIGDLVKKNPAFFNIAAASIDGFESVAGKLPDPAALQKFISLIGERDLTQGSPVGPFTAFYGWTAAYIHDQLGQGGAEGKTKKGAKPAAKPAANAKAR